MYVCVCVCVWVWVWGWGSIYLWISALLWIYTVSHHLHASHQTPFTHLHCQTRFTHAPHCTHVLQLYFNTRSLNNSHPPFSSSQLNALPNNARQWHSNAHWSPLQPQVHNPLFPFTCAFIAFTTLLLLFTTYTHGNTSPRFHSHPGIHYRELATLTTPLSLHFLSSNKPTQTLHLCHYNSVLLLTFTCANSNITHYYTFHRWLAAYLSQTLSLIVYMPHIQRPFISQLNGWRDTGRHRL